MTPTVQAGTALRVGLVLLVLGLVGLYFASHERVETEVKFGASGRARVNDYYAAERFLTAMGLEASSALAIQGLPDTDTAVLWMAPPSQAPGRMAELRQWVEGGGHLVWGWRAVPGLKGKGLAVPEWLRPEVEAEAPGGDAQAADPSASATATSAVSGEPVPPAETERTPGAPTPAPLAAEGTAAVAQPDELADGRPPFERRPLGTGMVTLLQAPGRYTNRRIAKGPHAWELWLAVRTEPQTRGAVLIAWRDAPSLWQIVWRRAPAAVCALGLTLLVWLWGASRRFGPLVPPRSRERRSLLEHVVASGHLMWQSGQRARLVADSQHELMRHLLARHPELTDRVGEALVQAVVERVGVSAELTRQALIPPGRIDRRNFVLAMRAGQELRRRA